MAGFRSMSKFAFTVSFLKSYSSSIGYSSSLHRFLTSWYKAQFAVSPVNTRVNAHVNFIVLNFEGVYIVVIFLNLVCCEWVKECIDQIKSACLLLLRRRTWISLHQKVWHSAVSFRRQHQSSSFQLLWCRVWSDFLALEPWTLWK